VLIASVKKIGEKYHDDVLGISHKIAEEHHEDRCDCSPSRSAESERLCEGGDMVVSQPVKP